MCTSEKSAESDQFVFRTFLFFRGNVNLLQTFVQSAQMNPRQVVGFVSPLCHYQGQLKVPEGGWKQHRASLYRSADTDVINSAPHQLT